MKKTGLKLGKQQVVGDSCSNFNVTLMQNINLCEIKVDQVPKNNSTMSSGSLPATSSF
jgi:hypothetical protein